MRSLLYLRLLRVQAGVFFFRSETATAGLVAYVTELQFLFVQLPTLQG